MNNHKLHQLIDMPTSVTSQSATFLDKIVANQPHTHHWQHVADHNLITATINLRRPKHKPEMKTFRQLKKYSDYLRNLWMSESVELNKTFHSDNIDT